MLQQLDTLLAPAARDKGLALQLSLADTLPWAVAGDPQRLGQVLLNLGTSAVKFTERAQVQVGVTLLEQQSTAVRLRFEVRDTGIGIGPAQRPSARWAGRQRRPIKLLRKEDLGCANESPAGAA